MRLITLAWMLFATANAATWTILYSPNAVGPYVPVTNLTSATGFVKLQGPAGQSAAVGTVLTISNGVASTTLSNGIVVINATPSSSNDFQTIQSMQTPTGMPVRISILPPSP